MRWSRRCSWTPTRSPGRLLYRFDAVIANQGGTLDLFRGPAAACARRCGRAASRRRRPSPTRRRRGPRRVDRSGFGSGFEYASRRRTSTGTSPRPRATSCSRRAAPRAVADKVGFCMFDSYGPGELLRATASRGAGGETWCGFNDAASRRPCGWASRPGAADIYSAQRERQWVDITGLAPGPAVVRGAGQPAALHPRERRGQQHDQRARADPGRARRRRGRRHAPARRWRSRSPGSVVAPDVPARRSGGCTPDADVDVVLRLGLGGGAAAASAVVGGAGARDGGAGAGRRAARRRRPTRRRPGFAGEDSFTYMATDARGLTSPPATARVTVAAPAAAAAVARARGARPVRLSTDPRSCAARALAGAAARQRAGRLSGRLERRGAAAAGDVPPARAARGRRTGADGARPPGARALPAAAVRGRQAGGDGEVHGPRGAASRLEAAWLPSDTSRWAGFRSAGAPRSPSRR